MKSRFFTVLLVLLSSPALSSRSPDLVLWHNQEGHHAALLQSIVKDWSKASGIKVKLETGMRLTETLLTTKDLPDIVFGPSDLASLCDKLDCSQIDLRRLSTKFREDAVDSVALNGKTVGVPIFVGNHLVQFYNRKLAKNSVSDWREIIESRAVRNNAIAMDMQSAYVLAAFINGFSQSLDEKRNLRYSDESLESAFGVYRSLLDKGIVVKECGHHCAGRDFFGGKYAVSINGDWAIKEAWEKLGANLGVAVLPKWYGTELSSLKASHVMVFPRDSWRGPNAKSLQDLTEWMLSDMVQRKLTLDGWRTPARTDIQMKWSPEQTASRTALTETIQLAVPLLPRQDVALTWASLQHGLRLVVDGGASPKMAVEAVSKFAKIGLDPSGK